MYPFQLYGDSTGPLIVFLHGGGVGGWMWKRQVKHYTQRGFRCLVPEFVPADGPFSIAGSARELATLIESHAEGKPVIAVGFSLGAQVLISILSQRPALIDYAVVNSALVRGIPFAGMLAASMRWMLPLAGSRSFAKLQAKTLYIADEDFEDYYRETTRVSADTFISVMKANMTFRVPDGFPHAKAAVLVTVGEQERGMMKQSMQDLVRSHSRSTGHMFPGIGHGAPMAAPDAFHRLIDQWLAEEGLVYNDQGNSNYNNK